MSVSPFPLFRITCVSFAVLLGMSFSGAGCAKPRSKALTFCESISNVNKLNGKIVTIQTDIIMDGLHGATAIPKRSDSCQGAINLATPTHDPLSGDIKTFLRAQAAGGFYGATITGRFESRPSGFAGARNVRGMLKVEIVDSLQRERRAPEWKAAE